MKPEETPAAGERANPAPARKTYQKPQLQVYGDIAEITNGLNSGSKNGGSGHPNKHFTS